MKGIVISPLNLGAKTIRGNTRHVADVVPLLVLMRLSELLQAWRRTLEPIRILNDTAEVRIGAVIVGLRITVTVSVPSPPPL